MGLSVFPAPSAASKTMFRTTLTSGTSYTVPAGVTYLNVTLRGGGGGGGGCNGVGVAQNGLGGAIVSSTLSVTAGASIAYEIGAGGAGAVGGNNASNGGTTTFTGATSAAGGIRGASIGSDYSPGGATANAGNNGGQGARYQSSPDKNGGSGGVGSIDIEYWV